MPKRTRRAAPSVLSREQYRQTETAEHDLQASLIQYLKLYARTDVYFFAIPNAGKRSWQTAARMKAEGLTAGVADICLMLMRGKVAWLELKTGNEKQSAEQIAFEGICRVLEHPYRVASSFEEATAILRQWRVLKEIR
jgi:hypothetical protein